MQSKVERVAHLGKVDVLIAAWNRSDTIERAVTSALAQPELRNVIVVDDGSTDDTPDRAERIDDGTGRVIVERLGSNRGPSAARNAALALSTAPWVAVLDSDDFLLPGRMAELLARADGWDFVADDILQVPFDALGDDEPRPVLFKRSFEPWRLDFETFVLGNVSRRGRLRRELGFLKPLMRRSFLDSHVLRYDERLRLGEDYAFYANALAHGVRFLIVPAQGYVSVVRADSLSARHTRHDLQALRDFDLEVAESAAFGRRERGALRKHYLSVDARVQWLNVIEAFKTQKILGFAMPFFRSPTVSWFLVRQLSADVQRRTKRLWS
jgi:succinoglycan biosynthesis protein ExoU